MFSAKKIFKSNSLTTLIVLFVFCAISYNLWRGWMGSKHPFGSDVGSYYSYLDAAFIHHDLQFGYPNSYWLVETEQHKYVPKMSMGLAFAYLPGFLTCHGVNLLLGKQPDAFNAIYSYGLYYYAIIFVFLGLFSLRKILLRYYPEKIVTYTLIAIFAGTNLFYYTMSFNLMPHSFLFTLNVWLMAYSIRFNEQQKVRYALIIGLLLGLITLIRPTGALVALFPLLAGCFSIQCIKQRVLYWIKNWPKLILVVCMIFVVWFPQLVYWKIQSGHYFFYSYGHEGFNFLKPQITNVLFSFRKGWFLYTPIMILAVLGFYFLYKQKSPFFIANLAIIVLAIYILSCWWCWSWGGSFSIRALIDYYPYLAFGLAAFFNATIAELKSKLVIGLTYFLVFYSLLQTYQYTTVVIHWDNMTKESYLFSIGKLKYTEQERAYFNTLLEVHSDEVPEDYKRK